MATFEAKNQNVFMTYTGGGSRVITSLYCIATDNEKAAQLAYSLNEMQNNKPITNNGALFQMVKDLKNCIERLTSDEALTQYDKDTEAQWIGEAHELLQSINPDYYQNANTALQSAKD